MAKYIKASLSLRKELAEKFGVTHKWVKKSLAFQANSRRAVAIRAAAVAAGALELETAFCSECITEHTQTEIIQTFPNGAILILSKVDSSGYIRQYGEVIKTFKDIRLRDWSGLIDIAAALPRR